jgi:hypothetical protein
VQQCGARLTGILHKLCDDELALLPRPHHYAHGCIYVIWIGQTRRPLHPGRRRVNCWMRCGRPRGRAGLQSRARPRARGYLLVRPQRRHNQSWHCSCHRLCGGGARPWRFWFAQQGQCKAVWGMQQLRQIATHTAASLQLRAMRRTLRRVLHLALAAECCLPRRCTRACTRVGIWPHTTALNILYSRRREARLQQHPFAPPSGVQV